MSRTYVLPVTVSLTGDFADNLPEDLVFRDLAASKDPALPRSVARQYFPFEFDPVAQVYNQANQVIEELGVIDPVELWERTASTPAARNAPDDFIATISVTGPPGDPTGDAIFVVVDSNNVPRLPPIFLPAAPYTVPFPPRVATRYGLPIFTGDRIVVAWGNRPTTGESATVIVNLTPCDACELQTAAAAWATALKDCCEGGSTCDLTVAIITSAPGPVLGGIGVIGNYVITILGSNFLPTDLVNLTAPPGVSLGIPLITPTDITINMTVDPFTPPGNMVFEVVRFDDPTCSATGNLPIIPPA